MDFTPTGWVARYDGSGANGQTWRAVESWNTNGTAMVIDPATAKLTPASGLPGFERLEEASRVVAAFPVHPGWGAGMTDGWTDNVTTELAAQRYFADGDANPSGAPSLDQSLAQVGCQSATEADLLHYTGLWGARR
ncbi:hypothetical protein [Nonomuraea sp. JJY05]|jgi:hypothetical protein|uniref:hypothetical protein n=1 Tax=Nonomuraea sp. JJY05 TaxID=3350255 RepID=UPI00373F81EB